MTLQCDAVDNVTAFSLSFRFAFGYYESTSFFKFPELQKYFFLVLPTWGYLKCYFSCCFNFIPRTTNISFSVGCLRLPWSSWASAPAGGISFRRKKGNPSNKYAGWDYYWCKCPWKYKKGLSIELVVCPKSFKTTDCRQDFSWYVTTRYTGSWIGRTVTHRIRLLWPIIIRRFVFLTYFLRFFNCVSALMSSHLREMALTSLESLVDFMKTCV